jgi:hypothetical protein
MTDRELLEAAAKAADISIGWFGDRPWYVKNKCTVYWNPIEDNADAFHLAVKLDILSDLYFHQNLDPHNSDDIYAATRRAIVRAAAMIGSQP